jgi:hypothetical protein
MANLQQGLGVYSLSRCKPPAPLLERKDKNEPTWFTMPFGLLHTPVHDGPPLTLCAAAAAAAAVAVFPRMARETSHVSLGSTTMQLSTLLQSQQRSEKVTSKFKHPSSHLSRPTPSLPF